MSIIGSSNIFSDNIESFRKGLTGLTGPSGNPGPRGATGNSIIGGTGNTGPNLVNITINDDDAFIFYYDDGTIQTSLEAILGNDGYSKIKLLGVSLGNFSPLKLSQQDQTYGTDFPVDILTFKGLSSASSPYIFVQNSQNYIKLYADFSGIAYLGVSGGSVPNIMQNINTVSQTGITATAYDEDEKSILIQHKNIQESLVIVKPVAINSSFVYWKVDVDQGTVFHLNPYTSTVNQNNEINGFVVFIKKPPVSNYSKGITIQFPSTFTNSSKIYYVLYTNDSDITSGITFSETFYNNFDTAGVEWQNNSYFCPSASYNALNLISLGSRYLAIPAQFNQNSSLSNSEVDYDLYNTECYPYILDSDTATPSQSYFVGGLCCPGNCSNAVYESNYGGCTGYFIPTKRLSNSSLCTRLGSCCIENSNSTFTHSDTTYCNCSTLAGTNEFIWHPYEGLKTNKDWFFCDDSCFNNSAGACCDGLGNCLYITQGVCDGLNHFFQGRGVLCKPSNSNLDYNICSGGSGGCCDSGLTCSNGYTGSQCISENKSYLGDQKFCQSFTCSPDTISCSQTIPGISNLKQGDEYAGGVVVGIFDPNKSRLFGNSSFYGLTDIDVSASDEIEIFNSNNLNSFNYNSKYDYTGYGFNKTFANRLNTNDKVILVISKNDISYEESTEFIWSKGQTAWGRIYNPLTNIQEEITTTAIFNQGEGNVQLGALLPNNTFSSSSIRTSGESLQWLLVAPSTGYNGKWRRSFGLYNTHRLMTSKFAYSEDASITDYTVYDAIKKYNIDNPPTSSRESSWFIPSHDELAFISYLTRETNDFNINSSLLLDCFSSLNGTYWTYTGSFSQEDMDNSSKRGSKAWIHYIDSNDPLNNYSITSDRTNKYKVRAIKLIRCDGDYPESSDDTYKLWRLPLGIQ